MTTFKPGVWIGMFEIFTIHHTIFEVLTFFLLQNDVFITGKPAWN